MEEGKVDVKFGEWIEKGFYLWKDNLVVLIVATLLAGLLSVVTLFILAGPMAAGMVWVTLGLLDKKEPKPQIGDVFKGFQCFVPALLFCLVWGAILMISAIFARIPFIGVLIAYVLQFGIATLIAFGMFLIVDRKMDFWSASMASINMVKKTFFPLLGLVLVAQFIGGLGAIACVVGAIVTASIPTCIMAVAYRDLFAGPGAGASSEGSSTPPAGA